MYIDYKIERTFKLLKYKLILYIMYMIIIIMGNRSLTGDNYQTAKDNVVWVNMPKHD